MLRVLKDLISWVRTSVKLDGVEGAHLVVAGGIPELFDLALGEGAAVAGGVAHQSLDHLLLRQPKLDLLPQDVDAHHSQDAAQPFLGVVHRHGHRDHLAEAKGVFVGLRPHRTGDGDALGDVRIVAPHDSGQAGVRRRVGDIEHDPWVLAGQVPQDARVGDLLPQRVSEYSDFPTAPFRVDLLD